MKFKKIPKDYFPTILDRLTRFEPAFVRYKRVFEDIINKFSIDIKLKELSLDEQIKLASQIFNSSLELNNSYFELNDYFLNLEEKYFYNNEVSYQYLSSRINISQMISEANIDENSPKNLIWLKELQNNIKNPSANRFNKSLLYPIEKVILCEGETENILLETLLKFFNIYPDKEGILIIAAGGKNQVARKFYSMIDYVKLPFFILFDYDAKPIKELIEKKIRKIDKVYLIESGEFEDLIPHQIIVDTLNYVHKYDIHCQYDDFEKTQTAVSNLEFIYRKYGFGEFKKAQFAKYLKDYIIKNCSCEDFLNSELKSIAYEIKKL